MQPVFGYCLLFLLVRNGPYFVPHSRRSRAGERRRDPLPPRNGRDSPSYRHLSGPSICLAANCKTASNQCCCRTVAYIRSIFRSISSRNTRTHAAKLLSFQKSYHFGPTPQPSRQRDSQKPGLATRHDPPGPNEQAVEPQPSSAIDEQPFCLSFLLF